MSDRTTNRIAPGGGFTVTVGANQTIRGAGLLAANTGGLINQGTIIADGTNRLRLTRHVIQFYEPRYTPRVWQRRIYTGSWRSCEHRSNH